MAQTEDLMTSQGSPKKPLFDSLDQMIDTLSSLSEAITLAYFSHADVPQQLVKGELMRYRVRHRNRYKYGQPVSLCHSHATLLPRDTLNQQVLGARMTIFPMIEDVHERQDLFGNRVSQFSIDEVHTELNVLAESEVEVRSNRIDLDRDTDWADTSAIPAKTRLFLRPSLYVSIRNQAIEQFAEQFFARTSKLQKPPRL